MAKKNHMGFYSNQSDEELLDRARKYHKGKSRTEVEKSEVGLYRNLKKRGLLETLVSEETFITTRMPNGFYSTQSDEEILDRARKYHKGKSTKELQQSEWSLCNELRKRELLRTLVDEGVIERYPRHYSSQSDEEILDIVRQDHSEKSRTELCRENNTLYEELRKRKLLKVLADEGTFTTPQIPPGFYTSQSDEELLNYARQHHQGKDKSKVAKEQSALYKELMKRRLIEPLVIEGTLNSRLKPAGFYTSQSDEELLNYARQHHQGESKSQVSKFESRLYNELRERGLLENLVEEGTFSRAKSPDGFYTSQSDEELLDYARQHHQGGSKSELHKNNNAFYEALRKRKLLNVLVDEGTFTTLRKPDGFYTSQSNEELLDYTRKHHHGESKNKLIHSEGSLYIELRKRKLLKTLTKEGTLVEIRSHNMNSQEFITFLQQDQTAANLAIAAISMGTDSYDIEKILTELYEQEFPDTQRLHQLLQDNSREVRKLMEEGVTNLGFYLGAYEIGGRNIIPVLLNQIVGTLPEEHLTPSLEERLVRLLRGEYSPRFNESPERTLAEIKEKVDSSDGNKRNLYQKLYDHYEGVIKLGEELRQ